MRGRTPGRGHDRFRHGIGSYSRPAGCLNLDLYLNLDFNLAAKPRLRPSKYLSLFICKPRQMQIQLRALLRLAKYSAKYVGKYRQKCRRLRTHLHNQMLLSFHLDLNLDLNLHFYPSLHGALLKQLLDTLNQQLFVSLFDSMLAALASDFYLLTFDFFYGPMQPPRRPLP